MDCSPTKDSMDRSTINRKRKRNIGDDDDHINQVRRLEGGNRKRKRDDDDKDIRVSQLIRLEDDNNSTARKHKQDDDDNDSDSKRRKDDDLDRIKKNINQLGRLLGVKDNNTNSDDSNSDSGDDGDSDGSDTGSSDDDGSNDNDGSELADDDLAYLMSSRYDLDYIEGLKNNLYIPVNTIDDLISIGDCFKNLITRGFGVDFENCHLQAYCGRCANCIKSDIKHHLDITENQYCTYWRLGNMLQEIIDLNSMIGMVQIKDEFLGQLIYVSSTRDKKRPLMNCIITGPPGHGKTDIARLIGRAFKKSGFLKNDKFITPHRSDLIGAYCGHTAKAVTKQFDLARGGVLFIDEAPALGNPEHKDVFTRECIDTINQLISERPDTMVILAGYETEMYTNFLSYNDGLERRFPWRLDIGQYGAKDLLDILIKMIGDENWQSTEGAILVEDIEKNMKFFAHAGGDMANLFTNCRISFFRRNFLSREIQEQILDRSDMLAGLAKFCQHRERAQRDKRGSSPPLHMYL